MGLIDKKPLILHLVNWQMEQFAEVGHEREFNLLDMIIRGIENAPTIEAVPVVHGEWEDYPSNAYRRCTICKMEYEKTKLNVRANFCPNCGADMRKKV